jgi:hypothetical protein
LSCHNSHVKIEPNITNNIIRRNHHKCICELRKTIRHEHGKELSSGLLTAMVFRPRHHQARLRYLFAATSHKYSTAVVYLMAVTIFCFMTSSCGQRITSTKPVSTLSLTTASIPTSQVMPVSSVYTSPLPASIDTVPINIDIVSGAVAVCYDGTNIWVTSYGSRNVIKLNAGDGTLAGAYAVGSMPQGVCFDGAYIWVVNSNARSVTRLKGSDGSLVGTYDTGNLPQDVCFENGSIWVANGRSNNVTELRAGDGKLIGTYPRAN